MTLWAIIPIKSLTEGKSRLSSILTSSERYTLNRYLLQKTLTTTTRFLPEHTLVVSACKSVLKLAVDFGAKTYEENSPYGLNSALQQVTYWLRSEITTNLLILPCDLPYLQVTDLQSLVNKDRKIVIATDRINEGTNAIYLPANANINYHFGRQSCVQHVAEAEKHGLATQVVHNPGIAFDLDTIHDYHEWIANNGDIIWNK